MQIRELEPKERFDARVVYSVAFHDRIDDTEEERADSARDTSESWGAFDDDGTGEFADAL